ncbi:glycosyltransferase family 4 protein [Nesterenkonia sp. MY13]|uniref:D-inositol 3-phosphate glycosyltransferase n=1 Tax=Nesterenkonia sedimenti TaxID=1463632 RepID=A0A7X8TL23_9MICC|nr:glycosyltransferase [Nesterenkonia sedimenti]NLS10638.1 glycosyltransferase family 4 protein [Nesterenkonia sedimenti]
MTERPLRILIAADTYPPDVNGASVFGYRLAQHMTARGHDVHIAAARPGPGPNTVEYQDEATIHRFRSFKAPTHEYYRLCLPWMIEPGMRRLVEELKPDVVHVQCHYMVGKAAILAAEAARVRLIATNHFMPENLDPFLPFPRWFKNVLSRNSWRDMGRLMGKASVVTTPTPLAAATMKSKGGFDHVLPLSNGIDIDYYSPRPGENVPTRQNPTVLFVGRLAVEKNVEVLIDAVAKTNPDLQISAEIVGDGEQRDRLRDQVAELGIEDRITFRGHIDDDDLREAYLAADVFCQPGTAELQSLVSLEAMSAGKPVVLADALALPHLVTQGENGYLFEPNNSDDLAEQLNTIFTQSHQERTRMGQASRAKAAQHAIDQTMSAFEELYQGSDWVHTGQFDNW